MNISRIDHLVLTVKNIEITVQFYVSVLGMAKEEFGAGRVALKYGNQKINLHEAGKEFEPKQTGRHPVQPTCVSLPTSLSMRQWPMCGAAE